MSTTPKKKENKHSENEENFNVLTVTKMKKNNKSMYLNEKKNK